MTVRTLKQSYLVQVTGSFCDIPSLLRNRASCPFLCLRQQVPKARYFDDHIDVLPNAWYQLIHRPAMRGRSPLEGAARGFRQLTRHQVGGQRCRAIQISATPTTESPVLSGDELSSAIDASTGAAGRFRSPACRKDIFLINCDELDARFEVLGAPYSLLSVSLSASQKLYTRRGTLVGVSGKAENVRQRRGSCDGTSANSWFRHNQHSLCWNLFEEPSSAYRFYTNGSPQRRPSQL
jgi:hypothetical protein